MRNMTTNFKTCMFGGFDREDVIHYIEQSAQESQEQLEALRAENTRLKDEHEQMEQALRTLHAQAKQHKQETEDQESLQLQLAETQSRLAELTAQNNTLRHENDSLRSAAAECAQLKERIADIEINAHRRTEEFRAMAIEKLHRSINAQRAWCQVQHGQYTAMNEALLQQLHSAQESLENCDFSGFDRMMESLQQLENDLKTEKS